MFETSPGSAWLVRQYALAAEHPVTSSVFPAVYRTLPNDTDFSIFARRGVQGLNFAFIDGVENYHTPGDRIDNVEFGSVQQQGGAVLGLVRGITAHRREAAGADAIFFDVLALGVVHFRVLWIWVLAAVSTAVLVWSIARDVRARPRQGRALARAAGGAALALLLPAVAAWLCAQLARVLRCRSSSWQLPSRCSSPACCSPRRDRHGCRAARARAKSGSRSGMRPG
jgi:hypothetical protein